MPRNNNKNSNNKKTTEEQPKVVQLSEKDNLNLSKAIVAMFNNTRKYYSTLVDNDGKSLYPIQFKRFIIFMIEARIGLLNAHKANKFPFYDPAEESRLHNISYDSDKDVWIKYLDGLQDLIIYAKGKSFGYDIIKHNRNLQGYDCFTMQNSYVLWMYLVMLYKNYTEDITVKSSKIRIIKHSYFKIFYEAAELSPEYDEIGETFSYIDIPKLNAIKFDIEDDPPLCQSNSNVSNDKPSYASMLKVRLDNSESSKVPEIGEDDIFGILANLLNLQDENERLKSENETLKSETAKLGYMVEDLRVAAEKRQVEYDELIETNKSLTSKINIFNVALSKLKNKS